MGNRRADEQEAGSCRTDVGRRAGTTQRNPPVQVAEVDVAVVSGSNAILLGEPERSGDDLSD